MENTFKLSTIAAVLLTLAWHGTAEAAVDSNSQVITDSDWQETETSVTTLKAVGIGTESPTDALQVIGNAIADDPLLPQHLVTKKYLDNNIQSVVTQLSQQQALIQALEQKVTLLESENSAIRDNYAALLARLDEIEDTLSPSGRNCLDIKTALPASASGFYLIDPDGKDFGLAPFKVWCDMDYQGGGWTLFANHKDNIENIQEGELISPSQFSVMKSERWQALRQTVTGGMMFRDEHGRVSQIYQPKMTNANCRNIFTEDNLADLSTLGDYGLIWHHEDTNCDVYRDFSGVVLGDKGSTRFETYTYQGASVIQAPNSSVKFDVWPYGSDESSRYHQNELLYFVK